MAKFKFKYQMYKYLQENLSNIYAEAREASEKIGIPTELKGKFGLTGAVSGCPSPLRKDVKESIEKGTNEVIPLVTLVEKIREIVKEVYGDEYDAAPVSLVKQVFGLLLTYYFHHQCKAEVIVINQDI